MLRKGIALLLFVALFSVCGAKAQIVPTSTEEYQLLGYPVEMRYQKYETDTNYKPKEKRISFVDDYTLFFNEERQLVKRQHYIKTREDRYAVFTYDLNRQLMKEELFEISGKLVTSIQYNYGYLGRLDERITLDYPISLGGANRLHSKESFKWNTKGQLEEYTYESQDRTVHKVTNYFYGPQDSLIYTETKSNYNKNVEKITYKRDYKHHLIEMTIFRNERQTRRETYDLNDDFLMVGKKIFNGKDKLVLSYTYTYDQHNYCTSEIAENNKGDWAIEYYYKYEKDEFFNWTKRTTYDGWEPKYIEERGFVYSDKEHFYDDLIDAERKKVVRKETKTVPTTQFDVETERRSE